VALIKDNCQSTVVPRGHGDTERDKCVTQVAEEYETRPKTTTPWWLIAHRLLVHFYCVDHKRSLADALEGAESRRRCD